MDRINNGFMKRFITIAGLLMVITLLLPVHLIAQTRTCPLGTTLDGATGTTCVPIQSGSCPAGTSPDAATGTTCVPIQTGSCPVGMMRDASGKCVTIQTGSCPAGTMRDATTGACVRS